MISFVIPFRARCTTSKWDRICASLDTTVNSILAQTSDNYKVEIIGHDRPNLSAKFGGRIRFHTVPFDPPQPTSSPERTNELYLRDRRWKVTYGCTQANADNPEYIMPLDADDRVSNRLVEFIDSQPHQPAWILRHGWVVNMKMKRCYLTGRYHQLTSSSCILDVKQTGIANDLSYEEMGKCYWFLGGHHIFQDDMAERGISAKEIPFPAGAYLIGKSENLSNTNRSTFVRKARFHMRFLLRGKKYGRKHLEEFGSI